MAGSEIILDGKRYDIRDYHPIPILCFNWEDDGLVEFKPGDGYNKERESDLDTWVAHWTGGEAAPDVMTKTLQRRKLGIETAIGARFQRRPKSGNFGHWLAARGAIESGPVPGQFPAWQSHHRLVPWPFRCLLFNFSTVVVADLGVPRSLHTAASASAVELASAASLRSLYRFIR